MNITDVKIRYVKNGKGKLKALASITIDDVFVIHDIKIIDGKRGLFLGMPARKCDDGLFRDIAHPISSDAREMIENAILNKYKEV